MIDYLNGKLVAAEPGRVILEVGGVGLHLETPLSLGEDLSSSIGRELVLYTRLVLREDEASLYGFHSAEERNLFNLVLGVSGFGPRLALSLLGVFSASQFFVAVLEENITLLCRAPGVGRKVAQRLVLELKEKLPRAMVSGGSDDIAGVAGGDMTPKAEVIEALCALGYTREEASLAVTRAAPGKDSPGREELLRLALKNMNNE